MTLFLKAKLQPKGLGPCGLFAGCAGCRPGAGCARAHGLPARHEGREAHGCALLQHVSLRACFCVMHEAHEECEWLTRPVSDMKFCTPGVAVEANHLVEEVS